MQLYSNCPIKSPLEYKNNITNYKLRKKENYVNPTKFTSQYLYNNA